MYLRSSPLRRRRSPLRGGGDAVEDCNQPAEGEFELESVHDDNLRHNLICNGCGHINYWSRMSIDGCDYSLRPCDGCGRNVCNYCGDVVNTIDTRNSRAISPNPTDCNISSHNQSNILPVPGSPAGHFGFSPVGTRPGSGYCLKRPGVKKYIPTPMSGARQPRVR